MGITHVLRGEDLLSSTPRQIALYEALQGLGIGTGAPRFGHLPIVMGEGNKRLSKRDAGSGLAEYVERGFLPEGLLNYLALLGWGIAEDRDVFSMQEMAEAFDIRRVNPNPARFDLKKLEAINAAHMRLLGVEDLSERLVPFLREADLIEDPPTAAGDPAHRGQRAGPRAHRHPRRGRGHAGVPVPRRRSSTTPADVAEGAQRGRPRGRGRGPRRAGRPRPTGTPPPSRRRCAPSSSRSSGSSPATRSARCGLPSPAGGSHRRCSSPWSCSVASSRWRGSPRRRGARSDVDERGLMSYPQGPQGPRSRRPRRGTRKAPPRRGRPSLSCSPRVAVGAARLGAADVAHPHPEPRTLPADAAHLGLPLVETGRRHPVRRRHVPRVPDRCCCRCSPWSVPLEGGPGTSATGSPRRRPRTRSRPRRCSTSTSAWPR